MKPPPIIIDVIVFVVIIDLSLLLSYNEAVFSHVFVLLFFSNITPLHHSAYHGHLETCRLLVESNANITFCRSHGPDVAPPVEAVNYSRTKDMRALHTPLKLAMRQNKADIVAYMRSIGAPE